MNAAAEQAGSRGAAGELLQSQLELMEVSSQSSVVSSKQLELVEVQLVLLVE